MTVSRQDMVRFLRCVSKIRLRQSDIDFMSYFLGEGVPWGHLLLLAKSEGVGGLLFHHLKNQGLTALVPKPILRNLESIYLETTRATLAVVGKAVAVSALIKSAGLPVIALQGLSVVRYYRDPGLRPMVDADFMVKPDQMLRLRALLKEAGYRNPRPRHPDNFSKNGVCLDIHTHILNLDRIRTRRHLFPADLTPMWERARPYFDAQDCLLQLDPFDNIVALAAHALKHGYSRLIWLADLHESLLELTKEARGWDRVVERARFWKQKGVVLYALILVQRIFSLKVPTWVKDGLGIRSLTTLEKRILFLFFRGVHSPSLSGALWLFNIRGLRNRLKFIRETVFPREEIMSQIFPRSSGTVKRQDYLTRLIDTSALLYRNLHQFLAISCSHKEERRG